MTRLEARIRRRVRTLSVQVFVGDDLVFISEEDVVKMRRRRDGVRIWTYWDRTKTVTEWWYPNPDEVRVGR